MASPVEVQDADGLAADAENLRHAARAVLQRHPRHADASMTIVIASAELSRQLNHRHRQHDAPADVLAFPAPALPPVMASQQAYLGDIVIAHELVAERCIERATDLAETLALLVIHATLHLLGHTHDRTDACDRMWAEQAEALRDLGIDPAMVSRYETAKLD